MCAAGSPPIQRTSSRPRSRPLLYTLPVAPHACKPALDVVGLALHPGLRDDEAGGEPGANAGAAKVVRVFSVDGGDGSKIEASVFPARAVIAPGGAAQIRVIVPFGTRSTHAYRVCAESRSPSGAFLGRQCGHYQARRVSLD